MAVRCSSVSFALNDLFQLQEIAVSGMHVGQKDVCAGTRDSMEFVRKGIDVLEITEDEGGQDEVGCGVLDGQCGTASEAQC